MRSLIQEFSLGFFAPIRGFKLVLSNSRIRTFALIPFLLTVVLFSLGLGIGIGYWLIDWVPATIALIMNTMGLVTTGFLATTVKFILAFLLWPTGFIALTYLIFVLTKVISAPFYSLLAERVLIEEKVIPDLPFRFGVWLQVNARMLAVSIMKAIVFMVLGALLFFLSLVPGLALVTSFGFLLIVVFDLVDYSFEALQLNLKQRLDFFRQNIFIFSGFALAMGLVFFIPGLNFFFFPAAVAGGADVVRRLASSKVMPLVKTL